MTCRATTDRFRFLPLLLLVSLLVCGCAEAQGDGKCFDTLRFRIENEDDLVFFSRALKDLSLDENLDGPGPYLVLAPIDAAFERLRDEGEEPGPNQDAELLGIELLKLISYHVATTSGYDNYRNKELEEGSGPFEIETLCKNCSSLVVDPSSTRVTLNGEARLLRSIQACNGLLLVMDEILVPREEGVDSEEGVLCDPEDPSCCDVRTRAGEFTCAEQLFYGFCDLTAGTASSFCRYTCGLCAQAREGEGPRGKDGDYSYHHEVSRRARARRRKRSKGNHHRPLKKMRGTVRKAMKWRRARAMTLGEEANTLPPAYRPG
ncbi:hypothetical protein A3770_06p40910 [Chloropicon primus]|uniref:FAS1 domain-containing protein n=1 Tax=Chloropicon primus TaxID=1764295 RepID=A0A5B8MM55_9CHLO|nr:hypothetical protein A3770_06p40910 [Chloropicon primus]|eukprot:QDZ21573.1 hypothetical protein A3770_06p40910 [Chloropicon primus]